MVKIGLTGGIGSGKSYVAGLLAQLGIPVYDSDSNARRLTVSDSGIVAGLNGLLGADVVSDGVLDRRMLADYLFSDPDHARRVNAIVHPRVLSDFEEWAERCEDSVFCVFESAILFETGFNRHMDVAVCVDAPLDVRIRRCMERDGMPEHKVLERIASQMDQSGKCSLADFVIVNDGERDLQPQILELLEYCKKIS